jgi:hypothetical protein
MTRTLLALTLLLALGCPPERPNIELDDDDAVTTRGFSAGWWFGECGGECRGDLVVTDAGPVTYAITGWDDQIFWTGESPGLTAAGEDLLQTALDATPDGLDAVYGCPDCADGGGFYVEIDVGVSDLARSEYEHSRPPEVLVDLDRAAWLLLGDFDACTFRYIEPFECEPRVIIGR